MGRAGLDDDCLESSVATTTGTVVTDGAECLTEDRLDVLDIGNSGTSLLERDKERDDVTDVWVEAVMGD